MLPSAEGLIQLADEKFSFLTALSGNGEGPAMDADSRLQQLEKNMDIIQKNLQTLLDGMPLSTAAAASGPSGAPRDLGTGASVRPKTQPARPPGTSGEHLSYPGIDPSVVQAAMQAGVREEELVTMSRIVGRKATKLGDFPQRGLVVPDVLGDSDGEAEARQAAVLTAPPGLEAPVPSDPVSAALVQLTNIVSNLADKRKKPKNLEEVLEEAGGAEIAGSSSGGIGTQRRQAAVFRALKKKFAGKPKGNISSHRKIDDRRFWVSRNHAWRATQEQQLQGVAGTQEPHPQSCSYSQNCLEHRRCIRRIKSWSGGRVSSEAGIVTLAHLWTRSLATVANG